VSQVSNNRSGSDKIELGLTPEENKPYMGYAAVVLGILGIPFSAIFTVIGIFCSIIAVFLGQFSLGIVGLLLGLAGIVTSPIIMGMIGLSTIVAWFT